MRTLTLKVKDDYFDKLVVFLDLLPKNAVKIQEDKTEKKKQLERFKADIEEAFEDVKKGRVSKAGKVIQLKS